MIGSRFTTSLLFVLLVTACGASDDSSATASTTPAGGTSAQAGTAGAPGGNAHSPGGDTTGMSEGTAGSAAAGTGGMAGSAGGAGGNPAGGSPPDGGAGGIGGFAGTPGVGGTSGAGGPGSAGAPGKAGAPGAGGTAGQTGKGGTGGGTVCVMIHVNADGLDAHDGKTVVAKPDGPLPGGADVWQAEEKVVDGKFTLTYLHIEPLDPLPSLLVFVDDNGDGVCHSPEFGWRIDGVPANVCGFKETVTVAPDFVSKGASIVGCPDVGTGSAGAGGAGGSG